MMGKQKRLCAITTIIMITFMFPFFVGNYFQKDYQEEIAHYFKGEAFKAFKDTWGWDYDRYYIGVDGGTDERITWPQLMYAHAIDYSQWKEEKELAGPDGQGTDWYYGERYEFISEPDEFSDPDPMECAVYVMKKDKYADKFDEKDFLIKDYLDYFVAYPRYWME